ncbi:hypothetical protein [Sinorhizobium meliloti]|nr:hypothetical protein [Sinorhizobium meliloti]UFX12743.1 hypothetical protein SmelRRI128_32665 [Sinorhizobium meliloti]
MEKVSIIGLDLAKSIIQVQAAQRSWIGAFSAEDFKQEVACLPVGA